MKTVEKKKAQKSLAWGLKKFGRWFRFYRRMVRQTQKAIGGELHAC
jgi:hypothetical protein